MAHHQNETMTHFTLTLLETDCLSRFILMTSLTLTLFKTDRLDRFILRSNCPYTTTYAHLTKILVRLPSDCRYFKIQATDGEGDWLDREELEGRFCKALSWGTQDTMLVPIDSANG